MMVYSVFFVFCFCFFVFFFFKQKTAYEMRISDWSSDVCSSDLIGLVAGIEMAPRAGAPGARAAEAFQKCFDSGLMVRYTGDTLAVSPPPILEESQIAEMFQSIGKVDRKRVGEGKRVSVRVDLGGCRIIKKKNNNESKMLT